MVCEPIPGEGARARHRLEIVAGDGVRRQIADWVCRAIPEIAALPGGYEALGVMRDGEIVGATLFTNWTSSKGGGNIDIWAVGHNWLSRRIIREILSYPFVQLGCHRLTALTPKSNRPSRRLLEGLGFKLEGIARQGFGPRSHAAIYSMLREECRWIKDDKT